jgi:hypothetical protein
MSELDRLIELNNRLQLVGKGNDVAERERFCSSFTHEAARLLHGEGWRRIRKTVGANVDGMDIDKLVNVHTMQIVDIIVDAGIERARVAFNHAGTATDTSRFIEVAPVVVSPPPPPPPPPPPDGEPPADYEVLETMREIVNSRDTTNELLDRIAKALDEISAVLTSAGNRFGL